MLFTDAKERAKAFAVYGAIAGGGAAVGLLLGGVLTEYADWRWCFWVNLPVAIVAIVAGDPDRAREQGAGRHQLRHPRRGLVTLGLASFVYGFTQVAQNAQENAAGASPTSRWTEPWALRSSSSARCWWSRFVVIELRDANPLLPMRIVLDRNRGGAYLTSTLVGAGLIGRVLLPQPLLPARARLHRRSRPASRPCRPRWACSSPPAPPAHLVPKLGPRPLMVARRAARRRRAVRCRSSPSTAASGSWPSPAQLLLGLGLGFTFVPLSNLALIGAARTTPARPAPC